MAEFDDFLYFQKLIEILDEVFLKLWVVDMSPMTADEAVERIRLISSQAFEQLDQLDQLDQVSGDSLKIVNLDSRSSLKGEGDIIYKLFP